MMFRLLPLLVICLLVFCCGCQKTARDLPLDPELARSSLTKALDAWVAGKKPEDLQPEIIMGDPAWKSGKKLISYEVKTAEEHSDGTNLHIAVARKLEGSDTPSDIVYIVGTSPVITIFPQ